MFTYISIEEVNKERKKGNKSSGGERIKKGRKKKKVKDLGVGVHASTSISKSKSNKEIFLLCILFCIDQYLSL